MGSIFKSKEVGETCTQQVSKSCFAALLLAVYLIGNTHTKVIHEFVHAHNAISKHTSEQEENPCHRAIYHDDADRGCSHKAHLAKPEKCSLCHVIFTIDQVIVTDSSTIFITPGFAAFSRIASVAFASTLAELPSRGPPAI
jgi:hypothetical protein